MRQSPRRPNAMQEARRRMEDFDQHMRHVRDGIPSHIRQWIVRWPAKTADDVRVVLPSRRRRPRRHEETTRSSPGRRSERRSERQRPVGPIGARGVSQDVPVLVHGVAPPPVAPSPGATPPTTVRTTRSGLDGTAAPSSPRTKSNRRSSSAVDDDVQEAAVV